MNTPPESELIRALKVQLTTVNGYVRMLEREIERAGDGNCRQRDYMNRLSRSLDHLQRTVGSYEDRATPSEIRSSSDHCGAVGSKG